jgi:hypothetical protein
MATGNIGEEEHNKDTTQYVLYTTMRKDNSNEHHNTELRT